MNNIGVIIKEKRESAGFTMKELSKLAGISPSFISEIENSNGAMPSEEKLEKIVTALGMSDIEKEQILQLAALERTPERIKKELELELKLRLIMTFTNITNFISYFKNVIKSKDFSESFVVDTFLKFMDIHLKKEESDYLRPRIYRTLIDSFAVTPNKSIETPNIVDLKLPMKQIPIYGSVSAGNGCIASLRILFSLFYWISFAFVYCACIPYNFFSKLNPPVTTLLPLRFVSPCTKAFKLTP